ncbi:unnamed protein product, partial [Ectocarpus sp. 13 AM-2016]
QGKFGQARPLFERFLAIVEKDEGSDHPRVASLLGNWAGLLSSHGKSKEAAPLLERSLAIRENSLGPDHPDVATSLKNLAVLLHSQ